MDRTLLVATVGLGIIGFAACADKPAGETKATEPVATGLASAVGESALHNVPLILASTGFSKFQHQGIRNAALVYPHQGRQPEQPLSLTADDGTGLTLEKLHVKAVVEGPLAFTELHMRFTNPQDRVLEGRFQIVLPQGATVSRLSMRMDEGWREAEVVEKMAARRAYEDFLHRKQDPMLLEKEAGNQFRARIFPIPARGSKEVILSYSHEVASEEGYQFPLRGLPAIADLQIDAKRAQFGPEGTRYQSFEMSSHGEVPTKDFGFALAEASVALRSGSQLVVPGKVRSEDTSWKAPSMTILFDTSASRAPGFAKQVEGLGTFVTALAAARGGAFPIRIAAFDQEVEEIYQGAAQGFGRTQLVRLLSRRPLGASDFSKALSWANQGKEATQLVIVSDLVSTAGSKDNVGQAKEMHDSVQRIDVALVGGVADQSSAGFLVRGTRKFDGVILSEEMNYEEWVRRLSTSTSSVGISVKGASWVWPTTIEGAQAGDEYVVYAGFADPQSLSGKLPQVIANGRDILAGQEVAKSPAPLVERAGVAGRIAYLQGQLPSIEDATARQKAKDEIVRLSTQYRVLSDFTALLVLESEGDYARFGIDRKALADILEVGPNGVQRVKRKSIVLADPAAIELAKNGETKKLKEKKVAASDDADGAISAAVDKSTGAEPADELEEEAERSLPGNGAGQGGSSPGRLEAASVQRVVASGASMPEPSPPPVRPAPSPTRRRSRGQQNVQDLDEPTEVAAMPQSEREADDRIQRANSKSEGPPALTGTMAEISELLQEGQSEAAIVRALSWRNEDAGSVMALVALGDALAVAGDKRLAARAYGSIIDLFPSRADLRRFAGARLVRLEEAGHGLAIDDLSKAVEERKDHLSGHRLLAYALVRAERFEQAFAAIETGLEQHYPEGRFAGGVRILQEDLGIIAAAWIAKEPRIAKAVRKRLGDAGAKLATKASTRFVLNWETDANDVDFHVRDGKGGHAYYSDPKLPSGGSLYADVTTGYGPECFTINGTPKAFPYSLQIHYYSRGPMGYGMGQVEILQHDGKGKLSFDERPFVVMNDGAFVDLGTLDKPL